MRYFSITAMLALAISLVALPILARWEEGVAAYKRGDYATALREIKPLAKQDAPEAQCKLGTMYELGLGTPKDAAKAAYWYRKAAARGLKVTQVKLGLLYVRGQGLPQDYAKASYWFRKGAEQGYASAQYNLGLLYLGGQGVPRNYTKAGH